MKSIDWFFERIGTEILRGTTPVAVTMENYKQLHEIQSDSYTFTAPITLTVSENTCVSCEG